MQNSFYTLVNQEVSRSRRSKKISNADKISQKF